MLSRRPKDVNLGAVFDLVAQLVADLQAWRHEPSRVQGLLASEKLRFSEARIDLPRLCEAAHRRGYGELRTRPRPVVGFTRDPQVRMPRARTVSVLASCSPSPGERQRRTCGVDRQLVARHGRDRSQGMVMSRSGRARLFRCDLTELPYHGDAHLERWQMRSAK